MKEQIDVDMQTPESEKKNEVYEKLTNDLESIFYENPDSNNRIKVVLEKIGPVLNNNILDENLINQEVISNILNKINNCPLFNDKDQFVSYVKEALDPLISLSISHPEKFEEMRRRVFVEAGGFIKLNEILSYGKGYENIHIHLAPATTLGLKEKINFVRDGLKELAKIVKEDENIKRVDATSWIVAKSPTLIKKLGFTDESEISEDFKKKYFSNEDRPVNRAIINRDEFLRMYLK